MSAGAPAPATLATSRVRLVDVDVLFDSDDQAFLARVREIFGDCLTPDPAATEVRCTVRSGRAGVRVRFEDAEPLEITSFAVALFGDRGFHEDPGATPDQRVLLDAEGAPALIASRGSDEVLVPSPAWRPLVGNLAISRAMRLQPDVLFLHAASVAIGERGVLLSGPKGAGKSTLALALISRGHGFLGDEIAAVRTGSWTLEPFRRAASIRETGRRGAVVSERLGAGRHPVETLPDGSVRTRVRVGELFPEAASASPVPARALVFLTGFGREPLLQRLAPDRALVSRLQPLPVSFWNVDRGRRVLDFLALLHAVPCFALEAGEPDETAALLEREMEGAWG